MILKSGVKQSLNTLEYDIKIYVSDQFREMEFVGFSLEHFQNQNENTQNEVESAQDFLDWVNEND